MFDFPHPILSVAADVLKDLDGEDALYGMWTLFTRCKGSLKDGQRLENLSWRLWYREMTFSHSLSDRSSSPGLSDLRSPSPITPISEDGSQLETSSQDSLMPGAVPPTAHSWHGDIPATSNTVRRLSTASAPTRPRTRSTTSHPVGTIILDILPDKVVVPHPTHENARSGTAAVNSAVVGGSQPSTVKLSPTVDTSLHGYVADRIAPTLPRVQLPSSPPSPAGPPVVVVNPTPRPTPPATPHQTHPPALPALLAPTPMQLSPLPPARHAATTSQPTASALSDQGVESKSRVSSSTLQPSPVPPSRPQANEETLKPSDRRFFLQKTESPDGESPEREASVAPQGKPADPPEPSPSSGTSSVSRAKSDIVAAPKRSAGKTAARRGKVQLTRSKTKLHVAQRFALTEVQRKPTEPKKPAAFNIGSVSSNGKDDGQSEKSTKSQQKQALTNARQPSPSRSGKQTKKGRKGLVMSVSSEDTESESGEWQSEELDPEEQEKQRKEEAARKREETRLRQAAEEAQRQRDLFAKMPKRSYSNLNRTRSGLLSQLLNPDPNIFPPNHPYRNSFSTQDMTQYGKHGQITRPPVQALTSSKSTAALPVIASVTTAAPQPAPVSSSNAYRPKGKPHDMEYDTESEDDGRDNGIQVSTSLAQQKLAALAGPSRRRASEQAVRQSQAPPRPPPPQVPHISTAPIPLNHPYNLPAPIPPMTPKTTRRQMLQSELSESLRRQLLWERQVSKLAMLRNGKNRRSVLGNGLAPLTAANGQPQPDPRDEQRRAALARDTSWIDDEDYHTAGW